MADPEVIDGFLVDSGNNNFLTVDGDISGEQDPQGRGVLTSPNPRTVGNGSTASVLFREELNNPDPARALVFHNLADGENLRQTAFRYPTQFQVDALQGGDVKIQGQVRSVGSLETTTYFTGTPQETTVNNEDLEGHSWFVTPNSNTNITTEFAIDISANGGTHFIQTLGTQTAATYTHTSGSAAAENLFVNASQVTAKFDRGGDKFVSLQPGTGSATVTYKSNNIEDVINIRGTNASAGIEANISGSGRAFVRTSDAHDVIDLSNFIGNGIASSSDAVIEASTGSDIIIGADDTFEFLDFRNGVSGEVADIRVTLENAEAFNNNNLRPDGDFRVEFLSSTGEVLEDATVAQQFNAILFADQNLSVEQLRRDGGAVTFANPNSVAQDLAPQNLRAEDSVTPNQKSDIEAAAKSFAKAKAGNSDNDIPLTAPASLPQAPEAPELASVAFNR